MTCVDEIFGRSTAGGIYHAGQEYLDGWQDATDAANEAHQ